MAIVVGYDFLCFTAAFEDYCQSNNIIAEFGRLHPWVKTTGHYEHDIYYIDLTKSEDEIWKGFDKGCRSAIKKQPKLPYPKDFRELYTRHMKRIGTDSKYLFTDGFWDKLKEIGHEIAMPGAMAIFLKHGDYVHYFLSANETNGNLNELIWTAIRFYKYQGYKIFNLGGGLKAGDSLESFKRSFTHDSKPFYTYRKIHNQAVYNELSKGIETDYFPAYRAERIT